MSKSKNTTKSKRQQQETPTDKSTDQVDQSAISELKELIQQRKSIWKTIIEKNRE